MKKFLIGMLAATMFFSPVNVLAKEVVVPEEIFTWALSTPRGNYYFNHQQINYAVNDDNTIDLNILIVPTICTYDNIQIEDVQQNYSDLIGRADYLKFDLKYGTVQVTERTDLDSTFTSLDSDKTGEPILLSSLSKNEITYRFYRSIIKWAKEHHEMLVKRSRGKLSKEDEKLKPEDAPINMFKFPDGEDIE